ncbi:auxin efflux carrier component 5-like [Apium graveolens]|uniref:auxin efflux carrier component 5-like n=1 Tax=Apium graveolens TaxID=4045 RepID=UPI003D7BFB36
MIELSDVYKVVVAMVPLYVALLLGYGSVKWWHMFTPDQTDAINRMNCYFIMPLFTFEFTTHLNPFKMNYLFVAGDVISKCVIGVMLGVWVYFFNGSFEWCITGFSMSTINNTLIVGVPLMRAMYGALGEDLVVQSAVLQSIIWIMILLFMLEVRRARRDFDSVSAIEMSGKDLEGNHRVQEIDVSVVRPSAWAVMKTVLGKLAKNPNCYACIAGLAWAFLAARWHFDMPSIMEGSILIMSKAGTGTSMFCMGLFMASNDKIIACGAKATMVGMILRFIAGPLSVGIACIAVGLRGDALRIAIVQSALPQAVATFIYAKEYGLHTNVISTAVIFGTVVSLPILIGYFAVLDLIQI